MSRFEAKDPDYAARVQRVMDRQTIMQTIGARLIRIEVGEAEIELDVAPHILQQHGFVHAGIVTTIVDTACGCAAASLYPAQTGILTTEFKVNLLSPAAGDRLVAIGKVLRPGKTLTVCEGAVYAHAAGRPPKQIAVMLATMMQMEAPGLID